MATLKIINNISMTHDGSTTAIKQGVSSSSATTAFEFSVDGKVHLVQATLATGSINVIWDTDNDTPGNFDYMIYRADQITYIQTMTASGSAVYKIAANMPFVLPGYDDLLTYTDTTQISTEPSLVTMNNVVIGNYSGSTVNYSAAFIT